MFPRPPTVGESLLAVELPRVSSALGLLGTILPMMLDTTRDVQRHGFVQVGSAITHCLVGQWLRPGETKYDGQKSASKAVSHNTERPPLIIL